MKTLLLSLFVFATFSLSAQVDSVYTKFDVAPTFEAEISSDGNHPFVVWVSKRIYIPNELKSKEFNDPITIDVTIESDGRMVNFELLNSPSQKLTQEILMAASFAPDWTSGKVGGNDVCANIKIPFLFGQLCRSQSRYWSQNVDQWPKFKGGDIGEFSKWLGQRVTYPTGFRSIDFTVRVMVALVVEADGTLKVEDVLINPHEVFTNELLKVLKKSPQWTPAMKDGKTVKAKFPFHMDFNPY